MAFRIFAYRRLIATELLHNHVSCLLTGCHDRLAFGNTLQHFCNIGSPDHFQELVRGIVLEPPDFTGRVIHCYTFLCRKTRTSFPVESLDLLTTFFCHEILLVIMENQSPYPPHVVYPVGIEEFHRPAFACRRKAS